MSKSVNFNPRESMLRGLDVVCDAVKGTLGPKGRNVWVDDAVQPKFTNDGFNIAKVIELKDPLENSGAKVARNTLGQTVDDAGDGTTTTAVFLQAVVHEAMKRPENPMAIRESLLKVSPKIVAEIKKRSVKIATEDIKKIALISSEDEVLATKISEIINKLGNDAVITVEDCYDSAKTDYEIIEGYDTSVGFMSPAFINQKTKAQCVMTNVPVFVTDKKITALQDISPLFGYFDANGITSCVIVCEDIENAVLGLLVMNKGLGRFNPVVIKASGDLLKDIESVVGATRVSEETGITFQMMSEADKYLGKVKKIVSDANKTLFIPVDNKSAQQRADFLEKFVREEQNMYIKERLEKRVSQLRGQIAVLKIAGQDFEREYLKDKADDAIKASKVALQEGVVEGGGMCLWRIAQDMKAKTVGEIIVKEALKAPLKQICENAGKDYAEISYCLYGDIGYDAKNDSVGDLIKAGIIDPAKVERCVVENSIANAAQFITGSVSICEELKNDTKN